MDKLEKVKKGLESCSGRGGECIYCPYDTDEEDEDCRVNLDLDILGLLKEKQPLRPVWDNEPISGRVVWFCPNCNEAIDKFAFGRNLSITHCPYCGQALDWKDGDGE